MLKFSINKTFFLHALMITKRAISSKNAIPVLSSLKLEVNSHQLVLTGSNGQISIEHVISQEETNAGLLISQEGSILLESSFFINVVSSLPDVDVTIEEIAHHQVVITSGKSEITLKGKDVDQYPRLQKFTAKKPLLFKTKLLKQLISETAFAASTQESRPILTGVHFTLQDQTVKMVATDSHRLSQRKVQLEDSMAEEVNVVLPSRSLRELSSVFTEDLDYISIYFSANQLLFKSDTISFYTRLLEGTYPDTDRLLNNQFETELVCRTNVLRSAMERAFLVSHASQNGTVKLEMGGDKVFAHVNSPEVGKVNEEIDFVSLSGQELTISFNPTYLIEALKALKSDTVRIRFLSPVRPFTLTPGDDSEPFIQLITPVRTN